jgi:hypothetical protein
LEYLLTVSRSHPLTVQKLAYKAWEVTSSYSPITLETVQAAFRASLDELAEKYSDECAGMRAADEEELLKLLYSLAERGWPGITGEERLVLYGFKESKAIYRARDTLMGRGILEHPGKGQYIISNPIFEAWLKQRNAQNAD